MNNYKENLTALHDHLSEIIGNWNGKDERGEDNFYYAKDAQKLIDELIIILREMRLISIFE